MNLVLDASTALSWAFEDEADAEGDRVMELLRTESAVVPPLWELEVANGLVVATRRGRIEAADAARFGRLLLSLPIAVEPAERGRPLDAAFRLAETHGLSVYDAAYLDLALRYRIPLATRDRALARAAEAESIPRP